jgi:hypothetical protein
MPFHVIDCTRLGPDREITPLPACVPDPNWQDSRRWVRDRRAEYPLEERLIDLHGPCPKREM